MISIEEFRIHITNQRQELKKYRTNTVTEEEKSVSIFCVRTKLFGTLGKEKITKQKDSYFSSYLTVGEVSILERKTRDQLNAAGKRPISDSEWKNLQGLARQFLESSDLVQSITKQILEKKEKTPEIDTAKFEEKKKDAQKRTRKFRADINRKIAIIVASSKKRKLEVLQQNLWVKK